MFWKDWHGCLLHFAGLGVLRLMHYLHDHHCLAQPLRSACRPAPALAWKGHSQAEILDDLVAVLAPGAFAHSRGGAAGFPGYLESPACSPSGVTLVAWAGLLIAFGSGCITGALLSLIALFFLFALLLFALLPLCTLLSLLALSAARAFRSSCASILAARVLLLRHLWRRRTFTNCYPRSLLQFIESINDDDLARVYVLDGAGIAVSSRNRDVPNTHRLVRIDYIYKSSSVVALNRSRWNEDDAAKRVYQ